MLATKKRILLVEDDSAIIDIYEMMMKKAGFDVEVASLGQEVMKKIQAVESQERIRPDIILLDLILPDMNGVDILSAIRKSSAMSGAKVFFLTNQDESRLQQTSDVKPDKFIVKANINPSELIDVIKKELN